MTVEENAGQDAEDVTVDATVTDDGGDGTQIGSDSVNDRTIDANDEDTFTLFEGEDSLDDLQADEYEVNVTVDSSTADSDQTTESFTVELEETQLDNFDAPDRFASDDSHELTVDVTQVRTQSADGPGDAIVLDYQDDSDIDTNGLPMTAQLRTKAIELIDEAGLQ